MSKKESVNFRETGGKNYGAKRMNTSGISKKNKDRTLPWWVEILFVQIGLPDKLLIKFLKGKRKSKELIKNEKKLLLILIIFLFLIKYILAVFSQSNLFFACLTTG